MIETSGEVMAGWIIGRKALAIPGHEKIFFSGITSCGAHYVPAEVGNEAVHRVVIAIFLHVGSNQPRGNSIRDPP